MLVNFCGYVIVWFRNKHKDTAAEAVQRSQHNLMWRDYEKRHQMNGGTT